MASSLVPGCLAISDLLTIRERGVLFTLLEPHWKVVFMLSEPLIVRGLLDEWTAYEGCFLSVCNARLNHTMSLKQGAVKMRRSNLFKVLIKTTVAQVLEAKRSEQSQSPGWSCLGCGALCLIEDESICSYFLRLFCVKRAKLLWEQEVYIPFKYRATRTFFHTFPADGYQVGFNFANETEAEEFYLAVEAVQRNQEKTISTMEITNAEEEDNSASDPPDSGIKPPDHLDEEQHFPEDAPFTADTPATTLFKDLDPTMRKLLTQARLTEEDLKDKDIAEAVDCIINQFGGIKAVQRELRSRNPVSQTLPRTAGASISLALRKGPLPPVPSIKNCTTSQRTPQDTGTADPLPTWVPPPPSHTPPAVPERFRKCASFKHVGSSKAAGRGDDILIALREVFRQKELLQQSQGADGRQGQ